MKNIFLRVIGVLVIAMLISTTYSCKSKKKAAEAAAAEKARMEQMEAEREAREAEEQRKREAEEAERRRQAEAEAAAREREPYNKLSEYFNAISSASSESSANSTINEAMNMFSSKDVPVLIIIYENEAENVTDYDEPTTIGEYLQYLKIVNRTPDAVDEIKFNNSGKIEELILKKK